MYANIEARTLESEQYKLNLAVSFIRELQGHVFSPLQKSDIIVN
jgi:hypothetical protein